MNVLLDGYVCPNCKNRFNPRIHESMSDAFHYDYCRSETICNNCSMVVRDESISTISDLEFIANNATKQHKPKKKVLTYGDLYKLVEERIAIEKKLKAEKRKKKRLQKKSN